MPCAIALLAVTDAAGAAVLCQKKTGAILVRPDACKKKESPFDLSPFVTAVPAVTAALHDTVVVTASNSTGADMTDTDLAVPCPAGYQATGGGVVGEFNKVGVDASVPTVGGQPTNTLSDGMSGPADGWFVRVYSFSGTVQPFKASVVCVKPGP